MARVSTYLNYMGQTEEAFNFYKGIFGTEFLAPVAYMKDVPAGPDYPPLSEEEKNKVMHVALPILGGHIIMGTDMLKSQGHYLITGNNISINLEPDTRSETDRLFNSLAEGGEIEMAMTEMFWGDYFGSIVDRYGVRWMFNCTEKA